MQREVESFVLLCCLSFVHKILNCHKMSGQQACAPSRKHVHIMDNAYGAKCRYADQRLLNLHYLVEFFFPWS